MNLRNKLATVAASCVLSFLALSAVAGPVLDRIKENATIVVATDANWPPQSFLNDNNELDGFDVDVAREIAKRLGVEIRFETPTWEVVTAGNWSGRWDMHVGSMTPTNVRAKKFKFPGIYYYTPAAVVVHEDSPIQSYAELEGKIIAAQQGTTYHAYLKQDLVIDVIGAPEFSYGFTAGEVRSLEGTETALNDLRLGSGVRLDAIVDSLPTLLDAKKNGFPIRVVGNPVFYEPLSVALEHGDDELADKVSTIVEAMRMDGTLTELSMKWYGIDYAITVSE